MNFLLLSFPMRITCVCFAGQGIARQRQAIVSGLRESVMQFSSDVQGIDSKEVMQMMMVTQYFDTLKDVGE